MFWLWNFLLPDESTGLIYRKRIAICQNVVPEILRKVNSFPSLITVGIKLRNFHSHRKRQYFLIEGSVRMSHCPLSWFCKGNISPMSIPVLADASGVFHLCLFCEGPFVDMGWFDDYFVGTFWHFEWSVDFFSLSTLATGKNNQKWEDLSISPMFNEGVHTSACNALRASSS